MTPKLTVSVTPSSLSFSKSHLQLPVLFYATKFSTCFSIMVVYVTNRQPRSEIEKKN